MTRAPTRHEAVHASLTTHRYCPHREALNEAGFSAESVQCFVDDPQGVNAHGEGIGFSGPVEAQPRTLRGASDRALRCRG